MCLVHLLNSVTVFRTSSLLAQQYTEVGSKTKGDWFNEAHPVGSWGTRHRSDIVCSFCGPCDGRRLNCRDARGDLIRCDGELYEPYYNTPGYNAYPVHN